MTNSTKSAVQQVEEGKKRLEALQTRRTRAQTILESERTKLDDALSEAVVEYEVDDLAGLQTLLEQREADNTAKATTFLAALDTAERQLKTVETQMAA